MQYTCNSCNLAFPTPEDQRIHMKSEWHRYNLKRRVAQLPPIDEDLFNNKVAALSLNENEDSSKSSGGKKNTTNDKQLTKKELRRREKEALQEKKRQILETARQAMIAKRNGEPFEIKEQEAEIKEDGAEKKDELEKKDEEPKNEEELTPEQVQERLIAEKLANRTEIPITTCLFCHAKKGANFESLEENESHMFSHHGLYIPEQKYLVDKEGLIKYLGEKIGYGNVCLVCNYQGRNVEAVREHMLNKRHMKIPYESENEKLEISEFYDFSSTYDSNAVQVNGDEGDAEEGDWEDVSSGEEGDDDDEELPPNDNNALYQNNKELVLPSGAVIGHRSLARYYRQNLPPDRILSEGQGTVIAAETRHFMNFKDKAEVSAQKRAWGREKKREDINDRRSAKFINNQPHYRDQLLQ